MTATEPRPTVTSLIPELVRVVSSLGRDDLTRRLAMAGERVLRPETVVAVIGEFKQGKSSLINGLLGEAVCPVDDDIATAALTLLRYGDQSAVVWRSTADGRVAESVSREEARRIATETGNAEVRTVELIEQLIPNGFLSKGIALVDTPGVGSMSPGFAGLTLGYLHVADALVFATDASAPLSKSEIAFLKQAMAVCPAVIIALTKTDLYPDWRVIRDIDAGLLAQDGGSLPIVAVSSALRTLAFERNDAELNGDSGFPELLDMLARTVLDPARERATARARAEVASTMTQVRVTLAEEESALANPAGMTAQAERLSEEAQRLERLRSASSRWQTVLNDEFGDLVANIDHAFRGRIRQINREADEAIEASDPAGTWDGVSANVREGMATAVLTMIGDFETGREAIAERILSLLQEESAALGLVAADLKPIDIERFWSGEGPAADSLKQTAAAGWAGLRGAQSGILVFGMLTSLAGLALTTGATLGIGALFGGKQVLDERRRQVTARRQKARTTVRQFLDDVQFEVGKSMRDLSRDLQRQLRDHFSERIGDSLRTCAARAEALQQAVRQDQTARDRRLGEVRRSLEVLTNVERQFRALGG